MKKLIIVRHPEDNILGGHLSTLGKDKIFNISERFKNLNLIEGNKKSLLTSTADKAIDSAKILGKVLSIGHIEESDFLLCDTKNHLPEHLIDVLDLVSSREDMDTLIIVSSKEYVETFPNYFAKRKLGGPFIYEEVPESGAVVIDCVNKKIKNI